MEAFPAAAFDLALKHDLKRYPATWHFSENTDQCFMKITWTKTPNMKLIKLEDVSSQNPAEFSSNQSPDSAALPVHTNLSEPLCKSIKRELIQHSSSDQYSGSAEDLSGSWTMLTQLSNNQHSSFFNVSPKLDPYGDDVIFMGMSTEPIEIFEDEDEDLVYISTSNIHKDGSSDLVFVKEELPGQAGNLRADSKTTATSNKVTRKAVKAGHTRPSDPQTVLTGASLRKKARSVVSTSTPKQPTQCTASKQTTDNNNNSADRSGNATIQGRIQKSIAVQTIPTGDTGSQLREKLAFIRNMNGRFFAIYGTDYRNDKEFMLVYKIGLSCMRSYDRDLEPVFFYKLFQDFTLAQGAYPRSYSHVFNKLKGYMRAAMDEMFKLQVYQLNRFAVGQ